MIATPTIRHRGALRAFAMLAGLALAASTALAAAPKTYTVHSPADATNPLGQPIAATASYVITPNSIQLTLTNTTAKFTSPQQALRAFSFRINKKDIKADLGETKAVLRIITGGRVFDSREAEETRWRLRVDGNRIIVYAPSERYGLVPETIKMADADSDLAEARFNPFLAGPASIQILMPDISLTNDLADVQFFFKDEVGVGAFEPKLTAAAGQDPTGPGSVTPGDPVVPPDVTTPPGGDLVLPPVNPGNNGKPPTNGGGGGGGGGGTSTTPLSDPPTEPPFVPPPPPPGAIDPEPDPLTPPTDPPPPDVFPPDDGGGVPEPASLTLLGSGAAMLLLRGRLRRS